jgi:hypothetical protein
MTFKNYHYPHRVMVQTAHTIESSLTPEHREAFEKDVKTIDASSWKELKARIDLCGFYVGLTWGQEPAPITQNFITLTAEIQRQCSLLRASLRFGSRHDTKRFTEISVGLRLDRISVRTSRITLFENLTSFLQNISAYEADLLKYGLPPALIRGFNDLAQNFIDAFSKHNTSGGRILYLSDEAQTELNKLYLQMDWYCIWGKMIFAGDRETTKLFSFSTIAKQFSAKRKEKPNESFQIPKRDKNESKPIIPGPTGAD